MVTQSGNVLIAGCGGLGRGAARRFARAARPIVLVDRFDHAIDDTIKLVADEGGTAHGIALDVAELAEVERCVDEVEAKWGPIETVLNTAGGPLSLVAGTPDRMFWNYTPDEWDIVIKVNLTGSFNWLKSLAPRMMDRRRGHVMLVASGSGIKPAAGRASYTAAKAGVIGLAKAAAMELGPYDVRVNAICPGLTLHGNIAVPPEVITRYQVDTVLDRLSTPEDFGDFVVCLDGLPATSGQVYNIDSKLLW